MFEVSGGSAGSGILCYNSTNLTVTNNNAANLKGSPDIERL